MTTLGFIRHSYLLIPVTVEFYSLFISMYQLGKRSSEVIERNQVCKSMFLTERGVPICYMDPLTFIQELNVIYSQLLVESRCTGINLLNP